MITLILSEATLIAAARDNELHGDLAGTIKSMALEQWRLLRPVLSLAALPAAQRTEYSLGHDALGAVLYRWQQTYESVTAERHSATRRLNRIRVAAICSIIFTVVLALFTYYTHALSTASALQIWANDDQSGSFSQKLKLIVTSIDQSRGPLQFLFSVSSQISDVQEVLRRSPITGGEADAIGLSPGWSEICSSRRWTRASIIVRHRIDGRDDNQRSI